MHASRLSKPNMESFEAKVCEMRFARSGRAGFVPGVLDLPCMLLGHLRQLDMCISRRIGGFLVGLGRKMFFLCDRILRVHRSAVPYQSPAYAEADYTRRRRQRVAFAPKQMGISTVRQASVCTLLDVEFASYFLGKKTRKDNFRPWIPDRY